MSCAQCGATLAIPTMREAFGAVERLAPRLKANAEKPPPHAVKRRLEAIEADLPRRREWAAGMQAEADARRGHSFDQEPFDWSLLRGRSRLAARAGLIGAALWLVWRFWR
ncbi:MAG: hypothetical protein ABI699_15530, partial [Caldimonas sp.]